MDTEESSIIGIHWHAIAQKWMVTINGEYAGLYAELDAAIAAKQATELGYSALTSKHQAKPTVTNSYN